ncbi:MAG TPA: hypothetical protein VMB53_01815 [Gaiellaceae bacterium]|nr:hypothetical protein [Gaiellaceae bacterium]
MAGVLLLAGGGLVGLACFLPWISVSIQILGVSGTGHVHGTDFTSGKVALVLAFVSVLLAVVDLRGGDGSLRRWSIGAALAGSAIVVYNAWHKSSTFAVAASGTSFAHASTGPGLWVGLLGGAAAVAAAIVGRAAESG